MLGFFVYRCIFEVTKLLCYAKNSNSLQPRSFFHILTLIGTSHQYKAIYSSICAMHKFGKFSSLIQRMYDVDKLRSFIIMLYYWNAKLRKAIQTLNQQYVKFNVTFSIWRWALSRSVNINIKLWLKINIFVWSLKRCSIVLYQMASI